MKEESWKPIKGFEGIVEVSNLGRIKYLERDIHTEKDSKVVISHRKERIVEGYPNRDGYLTVKLCKDGKALARVVHRLVAEAFIPNPNNLSEVDHINTIRTDNRAENLRWCSRYENTHNPLTLQHYKQRDITGEKNPNWKNKTLHNKLKDNPQLRFQYFSRKGKQNGRCRKVYVYRDNQLIKEFDYIGECCLWLKDEFNLKTKVNSLRSRISGLMKTGKPFRNMIFSDCELCQSVTKPTECQNSK